jgi:YVTN family beta-propeller protein
MMAFESTVYLISSYAKALVVVWASSKEVLMRDNRTWFWDSSIRNRDNRLIYRWLLCCFALPILAGLMSVPAAAQCDAYVAQNASNSTWVINTLTDALVAVIPVQFSPLGVAITPNGAYAYVTNTGAVCNLCPVNQPSSVSVIDTATYKVVATIQVGQYPAGVAVTPNGAFAYVANFNSNSVSVIDTATNTVTATVTVGINPLGVAITPNGALAYVTNYTSASVSVISTTTNTVVATVAVGSPPWGAAITPNGAFAYVTNPRSNNVSVINTATNTVVATIALGCGPEPVAITPNGAFAYVANSCDSTVSVIDTATNTVVAIVAVEGGPDNLTITPDGSFAYTSNFLTNNLSVIDTATNTVVGTVQAAGTQPLGIAIKLRPDALTQRCR